MTKGEQFSPGEIWIYDENPITRPADYLPHILRCLAWRTMKPLLIVIDRGLSAIPPTLCFRKPREDGKVFQILSDNGLACIDNFIDLILVLGPPASIGRHLNFLLAAVHFPLK